MSLDVITLFILVMSFFCLGLLLLLPVAVVVVAAAVYSLCVLLFSVNIHDISLFVFCPVLL